MKEFFTLNRLMYLAGVIVIGAAGSAMWEIIGVPLFEGISSLFAITVSFFFESYIDYLHADIGKGIEGQSIMSLVYLVLILILFLITIVIVLKSIKFKSPTPLTLFEDDNESKSPVVWSSYVGIVLSLLGMLLLTSSFVKNDYNEKAVIFVERAIDILSPQLYEQNKGWDKILSLQAQYRTVDNAEKFHTLYRNLNQIAHEQKVTLPYFQSFNYKYLEEDR